MNTNKQQPEALVIAANSAQGTHEGHITCTLDMSIDKNLLVTAGSADQYVRTCNAGDRPIGVVMDNGVGGDVIDIALVGLTRETVLLRTNDAMKMGDWVYAADRGRVITHVPEETEKRFFIGMAVASAPAGGLVEVNTCIPREAEVFCHADMERLQGSRA